MRVIGYTKNGGVEVLGFHEKPDPTPGARDIIVDIRATSLNPVDWKLRNGLFGPVKEGETAVVGFDGAGVVTAVGSDAKKFKVGDEVYFSGCLGRDGSLGDLCAVDERIAALKPKSLSFADAAAFPLVTITTWEGLEEMMSVQKGKTLLMEAGAGGIGSMGIQLAKKVFGLTVVGTSSRPESAEWVKKMGADHVVNHKEPYGPQLEKLGLQVHYAFSANSPDKSWDQFKTFLQPFGAANFINGASEPVELGSVFMKNIRFSQSIMFSRAMHNCNPDRTGEILAKTAALIDDKTIQPIKVEEYKWDQFAEAFTSLESGKAIGKIVIAK